MAHSPIRVALEVNRGIQDIERLQLHTRLSRFSLFPLNSLPDNNVQDCVQQTAINSIPINPQLPPSPALNPSKPLQELSSISDNCVLVLQALQC